MKEEVKEEEKKARINRPGPDTKPSISSILSLRIKATRILDQAGTISSGNRIEREKSFLPRCEQREQERERATSELATDGNRPGRISLGIDSFPELHKYRIDP